MPDTDPQQTTEVKETEHTETQQTVEETVSEEKGIDVSNWQGTINWDEVAKFGIKHICIKMSEGATFVDPSFEKNWKEAKKANLKINCYHYFRALGNTPETQMENIRKNTRAVGFNPSENILAIDVEKEGNQKATPVEMADNLNALLNLIKKDSVLSNSKVMIYTSYGYWDSKVKWEKYNFEAYPLWVAHWGVKRPHLPKPWKDWSWWQHTSKGKVDGISGDVDLNWVKV